MIDKLIQLVLYFAENPVDVLLFAGMIGFALGVVVSFFNEMFLKG